MAVIINKDKETQALIRQVEEISGVDLSCCYQCKKCTSGCPMASVADCSPAEVIRQLQLQAGDELLDQEIVWACASCETCTNRCPMGIDGAAVMDALRFGPTAFLRVVRGPRVVYRHRVAVGVVVR